MLVYFSLLFFVMISIHAAYRTGDKLLRSFWYLVACTALIVVAGVRIRYVGTDASYYANMFDSINVFADVIHSPLEPGYYFLCWIAHFFSDDYVSIFTVVALVSTACFAVGISRYSVEERVSFFMFVTGGFYSVAFNGFRQGLANSIYFLAIGSIFKKNFLTYALCVIIAMFFHKSAFIAIPAYFLIVRKNTLKLNLLIVFLGVAAVLFFGELVDLGITLDPRYAKYGVVATEGRGIVSMFFIVALCTFFFLFKPKVVQYREMYEPLLNMFLLATTITVVSVIQSTGASGIRRLALYFSMSSILLWPIVHANLSRSRIRMLFMFCFVTGYLVYYALTLEAFSDMLPYMLNPYVAGWL